MELTLIKLGGSLITDKSTPYRSRKRVVRRLVQEIKQAIEITPDLHLIIGNGSGSFAHTSANKYNTGSGYTSKEGEYGFCFVQNDAIKINRICVEIMLEQGLSCLGVSPNNIFICENNELKDFYIENIKVMLDRGIIPFVYGDTLLDTKKGSCIYSCDKVISVLSKLLTKSSKYKIKRVISVGDFDGVLDKDKKLVKYIDRNIYQDLIGSDAIKGSDKTDVTGGMKAKLDELMKLAENNIESIILNGKIKGNLFKALTEQEYDGTLISL